jgi:broad specificity phosphatase PhoE
MIKLKIKSNKCNQNAGSLNTNDNIKNILIVSHGNRMRCLLSELFNKPIKHKFMNTAILLFKIRTDSVVTLDVSLHYEGEVSEKSTETNKKIYYTNSDEYGIKFPKMSIELHNKYKGNYNIYVVRHGEGIHNLATKLNKAFNQIKYLDPKLTEEGQKQAKNAGNKIKDIVFDNVFVSDLYRTKHTFESLDLGLDNKPIILPCANELNKYTYKLSWCDNNPINLISAAENRSKCNNIVIKSCKDSDDSCIEKKQKCMDNVDWSYYNLNKKLNCIKNNMILQSINYINNN